MFIRKKANKSGSTSIQLVSNERGKYKLIKTIGCGHSDQEIELLYQQAKYELLKRQKQTSLFISAEDAQLESYIGTLKNGQIQVIGPELIFGKIYDSIGFDSVQEDLFRHLVIARLAYPGSKLKTIDYLYRYQGIAVGISMVYRFLDKLHSKLKEQVEQIAYNHTLQLFQGQIGIVFYDMTTLYFETSDEDDLRKTGFSKDGKHQHPQIFLGLLVAFGGYTIGYDIFEGNIFEGSTLLPVLRKFENRFGLTRPVVVADAGLLSKENIDELEKDHYQYIIGARIKNESLEIKKQILSLGLEEGTSAAFNKDQKSRLIISYSKKRATKDQHNRNRGLARLEKQIQSNRFTKSHINNRGYNKYLKLSGQMEVYIDYEKFNQDKQWDGLKGYLTNTALSPEQIIENYKTLWQIEKAFRISKTDLKIRPIYHRLRKRIEAHICIAFTAYTIYKDLERVLASEKSKISISRASIIAHNIYQILITLPQSKNQRKILLKMDEEQESLIQIITKNF